MKKIISCLLVLLPFAMFVSSCKKADTTPTVNPSTCTVIFNDTVTVQTDSIHWDYYSGVARMQAFKRDTAIFTLWPGTVTTGTKTLTRQYLYWIIDHGTYTVNSTGGTATITNTADVLDGSLSATGDIWTGTGPAPTTIRATFTNVKKVDY